MKHTNSNANTFSRHSSALNRNAIVKTQIISRVPTSKYGDKRISHIFPVPDLDEFKHNVAELIRIYLCAAKHTYDFDYIPSSGIYVGPLKNIGHTVQF